MICPFFLQTIQVACENQRNRHQRKWQDYACPADRGGAGDGVH